MQCFQNIAYEHVVCLIVFSVITWLYTFKSPGKKQDFVRPIEQKQTIHGRSVTPIHGILPHKLAGMVMMMDIQCSIVSSRCPVDDRDARPVVRVPLNGRQRRARLSWEENTFPRPDSDWFLYSTDKPRFTLESDSGRLLNWREQSTRYHQSNTVERHNYRGG
ncbi:HTH_Tnp_Tc3_2 domain-containing protein [Caerostris darwini]|uniref:HTH_Tnp_Tc3_2 domain-containing protein n=1 Tax=Caerostris darwini TaxID=1538125 RepID=A0AAV4UY45_9ARAC|nr:HTH_Tnp_Tc3_2 domain-containing protein [Caerostris darwini]